PIGGEDIQDQGSSGIITSDNSKRFAINSGSTIALQVNGYDEFENLFPEPVPSIWSAHDAAEDALNLPSAPVFPNALALKGNAVGMNLLIPTVDGAGFVKAKHPTDASIPVAKTGAIRVTSDQPTRILVDLFEPTGDGNPPADGRRPSQPQ